ncbi:MFS transporter [Xylanimonas allomyrinae]|uniref:MFS transporter n=1 Tax=Xylanimonas allomyrinae TaxID=2509459 RepID=A0A4P6EKI1_9MICO|nr:MFS transporter [Xylanimonas allomyrinae]QAY62636.1 MFS transporter [Xylanimonas allomyrinae]
MPTPERDSRGPVVWSGQFVLVTVVNTAVMAVFYTFMALMAVFAADVLGAGGAAAGLAASVFVVAALVARFGAGRVVDVFGPRRVLVVSLGVFAAAGAAYLVSDSLGALLAVRAVHGFAFGVATTATNTAAQLLLPEARRAEGTGYFTLGLPLASAAGPPAAFLVVDRFGYDWLFAGAAVVAAGAFGAALAVTAPRAVVSREPRGVVAGGSWRDAGIVEPRVASIGVPVLLLGVAASVVLTFTYPLAQSVGAPAAAGAFFVVYAAAVLASRLAAGPIQDRFGSGVVVYPALAALTASFVVLGFARSGVQVAAAGVLVGFGHGVLVPAFQVEAVRLAGPLRTGVAVGTFFLFLDLGTGVGPVVMGRVVEASSYRAMYVATAVLGGAAALAWRLRRGRASGRH